MPIIRAKVNWQRKIKHAQFKITKSDGIENKEECMLAASCDYGQTILLFKFIGCILPNDNICIKLSTVCMARTWVKCIGIVM